STPGRTAGAPRGSTRTAWSGPPSSPLRDVVAHVARRAGSGGLRFHDLRHSYATWLISQGVPVNDVQKVMGHERASTPLDRYTPPITSPGWASARSLLRGPPTGRRLLGVRR